MNGRGIKSVWHYTLSSSYAVYCRAGDEGSAWNSIANVGSRLSGHYRSLLTVFLAPNEVHTNRVNPSIPSPPGWRF